jgi:hypothetical protein
MPELTHEVFNQPEPLVDTNLFESNCRCAMQCVSTPLSWTHCAFAGGRAAGAPCRLMRGQHPHAELRRHDRFGGASRGRIPPATTR